LVLEVLLLTLMAQEVLVEVVLLLALLQLPLAGAAGVLITHHPITMVLPVVRVAEVLAMQEPLGALALQDKAATAVLAVTIMELAAVAELVLLVGKEVVHWEVMVVLVQFLLFQEHLLIMLAVAAGLVITMQVAQADQVAVATAVAAAVIQPLELLIPAAAAVVIML
jgi:hypothetical protein